MSAARSSSIRDRTDEAATGSNTFFSQWWNWPSHVNLSRVRPVAADEPEDVTQALLDAGPFILIDYEANFSSRPEDKTKGFLLRNNSGVAALNVSVSDIAAPDKRIAAFPVVPMVAGQQSREVKAEIEEGGALGHDDLELFFSKYQPPAGINVLSEPIPIPVSVEYRDGKGHTFKSEYALNYVPWPPTVKAMFVGREVVETP